MHKKSTNHSIKLLAFCIIAYFVILVLVHFLFKESAPWPWLEAVWYAGDVLSFTGSFVLGAVAVWQTKKANDMAEQANAMANLANGMSKSANGISEKLLLIEQNRIEMDMRPFFLIVDWEMRYVDYNKLENYPKEIYIIVDEDEKHKDLACLKLKFKNTTNSVITIEYFDGTLMEYAININSAVTVSGLINTKIAQERTRITLDSGECGEISFVARKSFYDDCMGKIIKMDFVLENRLAKRYIESFKILFFQQCPKPNTEVTGELFCSLQVQDYSVCKCNATESAI